MKGFTDADLKLAIGEKIKNEAEFKFNIKNIKVIYPGINYSFIKKSKSKTNNLISILYIGRLDFKQKPLEQLIKAIEISSDLIENFHVIGNGPDYNYLEKVKNNKLGLKMHLYGNKELANSYSILKNIDLVILPSINESFMLTVYEMIALGFVTVYNDVADLQKNLKNVKTAFCLENNVNTYVDFIKNYNSMNFTDIELEESSDYISHNFNWKNLAEELIRD
jgi:hypothetical protein